MKIIKLENQKNDSFFEAECFLHIGEAKEDKNYVVFDLRREDDPLYSCSYYDFEKEKGNKIFHCFDGQDYSWKCFENEVTNDEKLKNEILGNYDRYKWVISTQHGFDGLMVAVLARRKPILVPVASMLLAYIRIGADVVNSKGDIPIEFITVIQGIVILLVAAEEFMGRYKKKLIYNAAKEEMKSDKDKEVEELLTGK